MLFLGLSGAEATYRASTAAVQSAPPSGLLILRLLCFLGSAARAS